MLDLIFTQQSLNEFMRCYNYCIRCNSHKIIYRDYIYSKELARDIINHFREELKTKEIASAIFVAK
jgi:hypothetical protein